MPNLLILACLMCAFNQVQMHDESAIGGIRFAHFEVLSQQYRAVVTSKGDQQVSRSGSEQVGDNYEKTRLFREFLPKFFALAREKPEDETALECYEWIIANCNVCGGDRDMYAADSAAWRLIEKHQTGSTYLPSLCIAAARHATPARERFLRSLPEDYRQPVEVHGIAFLSLAELLARKYKAATSGAEINERIAPDLRDYLAVGDVEQLRAESCELFRHVLAHYADTPLQGIHGFEETKTLGAQAALRLHELETPQVTPNLTENSADSDQYVPGS